MGLEGANRAEGLAGELHKWLKLRGHSSKSNQIQVRAENRNPKAKTRNWLQEINGKIYVIGGLSLEDEEDLGL